MITDEELKHVLLGEIYAYTNALCAYGFCRQIALDDGGATTVYCFLSEIALAFEVDWRECEVVVFVVKLAAGRLPSGYYVENGTPCRYFLQEVVRDRGWGAAKELQSDGRSERRCSVSDRMQALGILQERFHACRSLVDSYVEKLVAEESNIFSS